MQVFVVIVYKQNPGLPDTDHVYGVYTTLEKARDALKASGKGGYCIERTLDE